MLIMFVAILMILGGTLCGIEEEAVAFYPVLVQYLLRLDMILLSQSVQFS